MSHTLCHKMFTYFHFISFIPEHPPSPRHVKTHVTNTISRDDNIFSRHSMYSSLLHICRAPPCIRCSSSSAGVTRSVRDPPRCSSQLHGVPNQSPEGVLESEDSLLLESVALYTEAVSGPSLAARVFTYDPAKRPPECEKRQVRQIQSGSRESTADT